MQYCIEEVEDINGVFGIRISKQRLCFLPLISLTEGCCISYIEDTEQNITIGKVEVISSKDVQSPECLA